MAGKFKAPVFVLIAGFLLTVSSPASAFPRPEKVKQQKQQVEKATMEKSQEELAGAAAESQPLEKSQEEEREIVGESQSSEKEAAEESRKAEETQVQKNQPAGEEEVETIVPSPKDIKEATAIYVFLGWMWLSILVLIYFLRLKVKETDRIHLLKFFSRERD